jgi:signal transduction histidine kinase
VTTVSDAPTAGGPQHRGPSAEPDLVWDHPLLNRLARVRARVWRADRRRPWLLDTAVVLAVFLLFCLPDLIAHGPGLDEHVRLKELPVPVMALLQVGLVAPLWWRRRAPVAAFAAVAAVFVLQWSLDAFLHADIALLIALYSLALHGPLRRLPPAAATTAAALVLVALRLSVSAPPGEALFFLFSTATAAITLGLAVRIRRAQLAELRERAARLEIERDQRSRLAAAAERTRVAREMHDIIGHNLSVMIGLADGGAYAADYAPAQSKEALLLIAGTGRQALGELRRMVGVLRDGPEHAQLRPQPGLADLHSLIEGVRTAGPQVTFRSAGDLESLDAGVQLTVYRIFQEALTNTLKHAGAQTRVHLGLEAGERDVRIVAEDTGPAGAPAPVPNPWEDVDPDGHGLAGMRERAAPYGGTIVAGPRPGGGWSVQAVLDLSAP